jgi:hypothetical protein
MVRWAAARSGYRSAKKECRLRSVTPNASVWQSGKLIDHPAKMCRLIARKYGVTDCQVPEQERDLGLRVIAHEDRR